MNERDLLNQASRSLREQYDGQFAGSGFTRGQVMKRLHQKRKRRLLAWLGLTPMAVLVAGSAWAQATHSWPAVWQGVQGGVSLALGWVAPSAAPRVAGSNKKPQQAASKAQAPSAVELTPATPEAVTAPALELPAAPAASGEQAVSGKQAALEAVLSPAEQAPRVAAKARVAPQPRSPASGLDVSPTLPSELPFVAPLEPQHDPELVAFRKAHDTFVSGGGFAGGAAAALRAYQSYLQAYPSGRFVPEARYNQALARLKLGQVQQAKSELTLFAAGHFGNYRRAQAQALLLALEQQAQAEQLKP